MFTYLLDLLQKSMRLCGGGSHAAERRACPPSGMLREEHDAIAGLVALGFPEREAREALKDVPADIKGTSARIKYALKHLGK